jgi:hypothetical protein
VLGLILSIIIFWFAFRWLLPRMTAPIEPPPPQVVIRLHLIVPAAARQSK